jgi:L-lysine exporter family protein LysE/ArgO
MRGTSARNGEKFIVMLANYLLSAFLLGIIVAIPPGSVTVIACQRAMQFGFKNSLVFTTGSCISDIFYISCVYYGLTNFVNHNSYKIILWIICGLLLIIIGLITIRGLKSYEIDNSIDNTVMQSRPLFTFISGILITLTNPLTILGWIAIAGNFFLIWNNKFPFANEYGIITITVIMIGVLSWFVPLTYAASKLKKLLNIKLQKYLIAVSGICLIIFGNISLYSAFKLAMYK